MKIFEFQFNPKAKSDRFFRVFSFQAPQEMTERGSMYILGELQNALPTNSAFLDRLASLLQQEYYDAEKPNQSTPQRLKNALKKANNFLADETKNGNVDWLGNLHFLLLLFVPTSHGYTLYFTKVGGMKLWMARKGSLVDAGKSIENAKKDEGSAKIFGNVGSGRVLPQDRIAALTQEAFDFFSKENFLQTVAQLKEEKQFKNIFKSKEREMSQLSGVLLFVLVEASEPREEKNQPAIAPLALGILRKIPRPALTWRGRPAIPFPSWAFVRKKLPFLMVSEAKKRMGLFALLLFVLLLGFAIWGDGQKNTNNTQEVLEQNEITEELRVLHNIVEITEPEVVAEFNQSFVAESPQRMIQLGSRFYFFGPSSSNVVMFDTSTHATEVFSAGKNLAFGTYLENSLLLFAEPNILVSVDKQNTVIQNTLASFPAELQIGGMEQFAGNFYFVDLRSGEILKTPISSVGEASFEHWLDPLSPKKPINAQSMSIDGNIWILTTENEIQRYFRGRYQESLKPEIFPAFQKPILLKTGPQLPYLYILEPQEQRLVILAKSGQVRRQYHSPSFKQARDFAISPNAETLYFFDGVKLYRISPVVLEST